MRPCLKYGADEKRRVAFEMEIVGWERGCQTPWKIQKNLLSIDGPSLSERGWTSREHEREKWESQAANIILGQRRQTGFFQTMRKIKAETYGKCHGKDFAWIVLEVTTDWNLFYALIVKAFTDFYRGKIFLRFKFCKTFLKPCPQSRYIVVVLSIWNDYLYLHCCRFSHFKDPP